MTPERHERWMRRALDLARMGEGLTRPNPPVGALVVRGGRCVGEGYHRRAGGAHAEVIALRQAGPLARGSTLYVTLEPCCTTGRTPPCTDLIRAAGIRRVVAGIRDPNPAHRGRGFRVLRAAGIETVCPVCAAEARDLIAPFASWMLRGRPWVTLKLAATLDGRIADAAGCSKWISSPASRRRVQALRRAADAILVGAGTLRADNPSLLPRPALGRKPWRVIVAGRGAVSPSARVFTDEAADRTLYAVTPASAASPSTARRLDLPERGGRADLAALMGELRGMGILHVLCEGGGELAGELLRLRLADEVVWFAAPSLLGGDGCPALAGSGWPIRSSPRLTRIERAISGADIVLQAHVQYAASHARKSVSKGRRPTPSAQNPAPKTQHLKPMPLPQRRRHHVYRNRATHGQH